MALQTATDFFKNLPPKQCTNCGNEIDEMHDCYTHQCEKCDTEVK
ncbi:YhfH family protein [Anaerobacillus arseniciselenatis]|uniref:YhfH family protein n=1 Tax=Anaerobacillus arseniciselenatis TaxID=85682 RepID=A0A1S2LK31_9BACI|nr:protein YhfH [Anaerobacillus arseniciselenatis]OIJ12781.1 YhfH family protein [Anaerobacillus arseniciselenatis]